MPIEDAGHRFTCPCCGAKLEPIAVHHRSVVSGTRTCGGCGQRWQLRVSGRMDRGAVVELTKLRIRLLPKKEESSGQ